MDAESAGDVIFGLFGAPVGHEDHPQRALYAALRMQEDIQRAGRAHARRIYTQVSTTIDGEASHATIKWPRSLGASDERPKQALARLIDGGRGVENDTLLLRDGRSYLQILFDLGIHRAVPLE